MKNLMHLTQSAPMEWTWTYLALLCLTLRSCSSNSAAQNEVARKRLIDDLQKFNNFTWTIIEKSNDLTSLTVDNILQDLIDKNITGNQKYATTCHNRSGIYQIKLEGLQPFSVLCDSKIAGPGWMVVLKRSDGLTNFFRNWIQYKNGFGDLSSEFFIGLDHLHALTHSKTHEIYFHLEDFEGNTRHARYDEFLIGNAKSFYKLEKLGRFSGDAGDSMSYVAGHRFYTYDDDSNHHCVALRASAGWFNNCIKTNLFGLYISYGSFKDEYDYKPIWWETWRGDRYSLKTVQMMIRPK